MRIVCPSCQAAYEVPDAILAAGPKLVRCARCGTEWTPPPLAAPIATEQVVTEPAAPAAAEPQAGLPPPRAEPRLSSFRQRPPPVADVPPAGGADHGLPPEPARPPPLYAAILGWVLSVALLAGLGWAAVTWRASVMAAWPPSERVYMAVGLR